MSDVRQLLSALLEATTGDQVMVPRAWLTAALEPPATVADRTVEQVAAALHRGPSTVRGWCSAGRFPGAYRLAHREWRIPPAALAAFLRGQAPAGATRSGGGELDLGAWRRARPPDSAA